LIQGYLAFSLNDHLIQNITQIVIPVIHDRHIPGEKPVNHGGTFIGLFVGQHHYNFPVLKKLFFPVQVIERLFAVNPKHQNRGIHTWPDPADDGDTGIKALAHLNPGAGQPLLDPLQKKPASGS
jgi:hypothetical protein